jgi:hypothetical protein
MSELFYTCPKTKLRATTGIETNVQSLRKAWTKMLKVQCSFCGDVHEITVRETYIQAALHDATDRLGCT